MNRSVISEEQLRAFAKCSEYYSLGGGDQLNFQQRVVKNAFERLVTRSLRQRLKDKERGLHSALLQAISEEGQKEHLFESQISRHMNTCLLWLNDMLEIFSFNIYTPILGKIQPSVKIGRITVKLDISGVFRSAKNKTIHAVSFSSYSSKHAMLNDPSLSLKLSVLKPFVTKHSGIKRPQVVLHLFSYGTKDNLQYYSIDSNQINKQNVNMVKSISKGIELGVRYPVNPCNHSCQFKNKCYPWIENV